MSYTYGVRWQGHVGLDQDENPPAAYVFVAGTSTLATLFTDRAKLISLPQSAGTPALQLEDGLALNHFFADPGAYDIRSSMSTVGKPLATVTLATDPADLSAAYAPIGEVARAQAAEALLAPLSAISRVISADQATLYNNATYSAGSNTTANSHMRKRCAVGGKNVQIKVLTVQGIGEAAVSGDQSVLTVTASVEYPAGTFYPAYSRDGNISITLKPSGGVGTLYVPGFDVPAGVDWWVNLCVKFASTGAVMQAAHADGVTEWTVVNASGSDFTQTLSGRPSVNTSAGVTAQAVLYEPWGTEAGVPCVAISGDSISAGKGDPDINGGTVAADPGGWAGRSLSSDGQTGRSAPLIANVNMSMTGETAANWAANATRKSRFQLFDDAHCSSAFVQLGTNDLASSLATIQANLILVWNAHFNRSRRVFGFTIPPVTTTTDGWATTTNQTVAAHETTRVALNDWLRAGAPMSAGAAVAIGTGGAAVCNVYSTSGALLVAASGVHPLYAIDDIGGLCESAQDSGLWPVPVRTTTDGAMSTGTATTLNSATAAFTSADVGRTVTIAGAAAAGAALVTQITAYTNATTVTVLTGCSTTVSAAALAIGVSTTDGTHPSQDKHKAMAARVYADLVPHLL